MNSYLTLLDVESQMAICKKHLEDLEKSGKKNPEVESFLTQFLLVRICGEYEKEIKRMVVKRASRTGDPEIIYYVEKTVDVRSLELPVIRKRILKHFSDNCACVFDAEMKGKEKSATLYHNINENRNSCAHGRTVYMTMKELSDSYDVAKDVLNALSKALQ